MQVNVHLLFSNQIYEHCTTRDLSLKGLWVYGCQGQKAGDFCDIEISEKEVPINRVIRIKGKVVRVDNEGIGILFIDMNLNSYTDLQTLLIYRSSDPFEVAEEFLDEFNPAKKPDSQNRS